MRGTDEELHVAAHLYLKYCREAGKYQGKTDQRIVEQFKSHWSTLFSTPDQHYYWVGCARTAIEALRTYRKEQT